MRRILILLAGVAMAFGAVVVTSAPAEAHNFDATSFWACGYTRPSASYTVKHSHPVLFTSQRIDYRCVANRNDNVVCYRWFATVWLTLPGQPITGHDYVDTVPSDCVNG